MNNRDTKGRFEPGNGGGPGRPSRCTETAYLRELTKACSLDDSREIVHKAVTDAKGGNWRARDFLAKYLLGDAPVLSDLVAWDEAGYDPVDGKVGDADLKRLLS